MQTRQGTLACLLILAVVACRLALLECPRLGSCYQSGVAAELTR